MEDTATEPFDPGKCEACGGTARPSVVNLAIWSKRGLVVVEGVNAYVCEACQEQTYDDDTASELRRLASADFPRDQMVREMQVPVYTLGLPRDGETK